jgi:hypothetical protein
VVVLGDISDLVGAAMSGYTPTSTVAQLMV